MGRQSARKENSRGAVRASYYAYAGRFGKIKAQKPGYYECDENTALRRRAQKQALGIGD